MSISSASILDARKNAVKKAVLLLLLLSLALPLAAQSTHSVTITWSPSIDAAGNPTGTYFVYRAEAACTAPNLAFNKVGSAVSTATTFNDTAVPLGTHCYAVTFTVNGAESVESNT